MQVQQFRVMTVNQCSETVMDIFLVCLCRLILLSTPLSIVLRSDTRLLEGANEGRLGLFCNRLRLDELRRDSLGPFPACDVIVARDVVPSSVSPSSPGLGGGKLKERSRLPRMSVFIAADV